LNSQFNLILLTSPPRRDRELEISTIEEERHKLREKEHGKNYLLETYLKGLPGSSSDDKQELAAGNSDSGVHTEETAASPEVQHEDEISETLIPLNSGEQKKSSTIASKKTRERRSKREHELMMEHQSMKNAMKKFDEAVAAASMDDDGKLVENENVDVDEGDEEVDEDGKPINKELAAQIDILERLIVLNKHLQREEELCVRLSSKIKRYEADASGLSEAQVKESLERVNEQLDAKNYEISKMEDEIKATDVSLGEKSEMLKKLYDDLEEAEVEHRKLEAVNLENAPIQIPLPMPAIKCEQVLMARNDDLGMSREYLAENIYNISKMILKNNGTHINNLHNPVVENAPMSMLPALMANHQQFPPEKRIIQAQIHSIPTSDRFQTAGTHFMQHNNGEAMSASINYLATINQRIQKNQNPIESDVNIAKNPLMQATQQYKLAPKKLLINAQTMSSGNVSKLSGGSIAFTESRNNTNFKHNVMFPQPPNDNCIDSIMTQDVSQLGTLV
jgi:hypothetical protein